MALNVETGVGSSASDSFVALADCDTYHSSLGNSTWTGLDVDKEAAIRRATAYVSTAFAYRGKRTNKRAQALAWPRTDVSDREGAEIGSDEVPYEVADATCEAALYELTNPNGLNLTVTMTDRVKREKVGVIETEYVDTPTSADAARPILSKLEALLSDFIVSDLQGGAGGTSFIERA